MKKGVEYNINKWNKYTKPDHLSSSEFNRLMVFKDEIERAAKDNPEFRIVAKYMLISVEKELNTLCT